MSSESTSSRGSSSGGRRRYVVGISGASGALYAARIIELLVRLGHEVHLTATPPGARLLHDELGMERVDVRALAGLSPDAPPEGESRRAEAPGGGSVTLHNNRDIGAAIASGSFLHHGMIVAPCSSHTLAAIATGLGDNLLTRAAAVTLKERRRLILLHRESPLTLIDIQNMERLTLAGAIVCPASPGFYLLPKSIEELVDFVVGKALDLLGVEHSLDVRWDEALVRRKEEERRTGEA